MRTTQGSLTLINPHAPNPTVFWNGVQVNGVRRVHVHNDEDESRVKLVVSGMDDLVYAEMIVAGINVKKVST